MAMSVSDAGTVGTSLLRHLFEYDRMRSAVAARARISLIDVIALEQLWVDGPLTQRELGRRLVLNASRVHALVNRLELEGWARRNRNLSGPQIVWVELSDNRVDAEFAELHTYIGRITEFAATMTAVDRELVTNFFRTASSIASDVAEDTGNAVS